MVMNRDDALKWFERLAESRKQFGPKNSDHFYPKEQVSGWQTEVRSALASVFPAGHAIHHQWEAAFADVSKCGAGWIAFDEVVDVTTGVFNAAHGMLKDGTIDTLVASIRAETETELLDQADELAGAGHLAAAAVIAGGSLETHLRGLCERTGITWKGDGSISKYNDAIAAERNKGQELYSKTDGKSVTAWGGTRNDAAHNPGSFSRSADEVRLMIDGIRQFIARNP